MSAHFRITGDIKYVLDQVVKNAVARNNPGKLKSITLIDYRNN